MKQTINVNVSLPPPPAPVVQRIVTTPPREIGPVLIPVAGIIGITLCFLGALTALILWAVS